MAQDKEITGGVNAGARDREALGADPALYGRDRDSTLAAGGTEDLNKPQVEGSADSPGSIGHVADPNLRKGGEFGGEAGSGFKGETRGMATGEKRERQVAPTGLVDPHAIEGNLDNRDIDKGKAGWDNQSSR